jgi:uncharacterized membrane protein
MTSIKNLIRTTLAGGMLFLIPFIVLFVVLRKGLEIVRKFTAPWDKYLNGEILWGFDGHNLVGIAFLLLFCFVSGLLFRLAVVKSSITWLESGLLSYIPGYLMIKSSILDAMDESNTNPVVPVSISEDDSRRLGFLIEEKDDYCTVFCRIFQNATRVNYGLYRLGWFKKLIFVIPLCATPLRNFGKEAIELTNFK